jgi:hypothetical protein
VRNITIPMVSAYCKSISKPWFLSAWSACDKTGTAYDDYSGDSTMALHAQDMEGVSAGSNGAMPALGNDFWNLGPATSNTCEIGPQFALTWSVIQVST